MAEFVTMAKTDRGHLAPAEPFAREAMEAIGAGELVLVTIKRERNPGFHRKYFALLKVAFDTWNPAGASIEGMPAKKSFDGFRKELTIAAGYYDVILGLDGCARLEAKSIAWGNMDQATFEELYESTVQVLTAGVLPGLTREQADALSETVLQDGF